MEFFTGPLRTRCRMLVVLALGLVWAGSARAQMKMALSFTHDSYLQNEPVEVLLVIHNDSSNPLVIDRRNPRNTNRITFLIEDKGGIRAKRVNQAPIIPRLKILPDQKRNLMINLSMWYDLSKMGRRLVAAVVEWNGETYYTEKAMMDVVHGIELKQVRKRLAGYINEDRLYSLRYWARDRKEFLFLCVSDPEADRNLGVFSLGTVVRVFQPTLEVNKNGIIKVQHQSTRDRYTRTELESSRDGIFFINQLHFLEDGRPYPQPSPAKDEEEKK